ncbi:hybrid sensor histidine kinase/response regulator [Aggregicoccus sp. 17bor-14]|nr:hybrid sensor histidine kinase/response regulator [Aggregicoccus sp. 17bor-14]
MDTPSSSAPPPRLQEAPRGRVWLVEDSPLEAEQARALLADAHEVRVFTDGASFLEALEENAGADGVDLVVLDWRLPGVSGLEACRFLRERYDEVMLPVLVLTASTAREDRTQALAAGANDFVSKPYDALELLARARTLVRTRRLAQAQRERVQFEQEFVGIVSHDLRTPLAAVRLTAETLLHDGSLDGRAAQAIVRIQSAAEHTLGLVRDLLDFTRARMGGGIPVLRRPLDLHAVVQEALQEVQAAYPERELRVEVQGSGEGLWDGRRMAQVVENLASNALKYSPEGTPVRVSTRGEADQVVLEVHNAGDPLAPELQARLFEPLQRGAPGLDAAQDRSVGLGLYIVRQLVRAHGGSVEVRSSGEEGTLFRVCLPRGP